MRNNPESGDKKTTAPGQGATPHWTIDYSQSNCVCDRPRNSGNQAPKILDAGIVDGRVCGLASGSGWILSRFGRKVIRSIYTLFGGLLIGLAWAVSAVHASDDYPARSYLEQNLARAAERFPGDLPYQRCWAAANAVWQYSQDHFGPEHARAWMTPWWHGGQWQALCDGKGLRTAESRHWGITCPYRACPEGEGPYISINHDRIYSGRLPEPWLHGRYYYVMAHEMAHAIGHYYGDPEWADEQWADGVASTFGAEVCSHSPYCRPGPPYSKFKPQPPLKTMVVPPRTRIGDATSVAP